MNIKEMLKITPENLAKNQHDSLKNFAITILKEVTTLLNNEKYDDVLSKLADSPSGDCMGCDNSYIDFSESGLEDIGMVVQKLKALKEISKK